ncbi:MAG: Hsp20/alpha crystallin family protein [Gammaproteobacteria bacterium]|nr:Hsp20/alpha crystallin family protein [Gammaproteobacteria bacterium]
MSERQTYFSTMVMILIFVMLAALAVQGWYMLGMQQKLDQLQASNVETQPQVQQPIGQTKKNNSNRFNSQNSRIYDDWFNDSFDPDNWDPMYEMQQMQDRMNQIFGNAFNRFDRSSNFNHLFKNNQFSPQVDVLEEEDKFVVKVNLPGFDNENVNVTLEDQTLTINGSIEQKKEETDEHGRVISRERRSGKFNRAITLPAPLKQEGMTTHIDKGVLQITLLKK